MLTLFALYRICQMTSNTNQKLEIIYVLETTLCIVGAVVLLKI